MDKREARRVARFLKSRFHYGIRIVEHYPEQAITVESFNRCGSQRFYVSLEDAQKDNQD